MSITTVDLSLPNEEAMLEFSGKLAVKCSPPLTLFLQGQLGAGKTTFARGFLRGLGYTGKVKSPSYTLVESYEVHHKAIFHFDFYRIQDPHELDFIGIQDCWSSSAIFLIEWPEKGAHLLPPADLSCHFESAEPGRKLHIEARTKQGKKAIAGLI